MNRISSSRGQALPIAAVVLGLMAVIVIAASGILGGAPSGEPLPTDRPSVPPTVKPTAPPTAPPTAEPSDVPGDPITRVALDNVTGKDVFALIDDQSGHLVEAASGNTGDGMSVRWFEVKVENLDGETLRVTWVGLPQDGDINVVIAKGDDGVYHVLIVQPGPPAYSDALGHDLILVLEFDEPVDAADVSTEIRGGFDTDD